MKESKSQFPNWITHQTTQQYVEAYLGISLDQLGEDALGLLVQTVTVDPLARGAGSLRNKFINAASQRVPQPVPRTRFFEFVNAVRGVRDGLNMGTNAGQDPHRFLGDGSDRRSLGYIQSAPKED